MFPARLSEIAILVTARHFTAHYEWFAHKRLALKGGMDLRIIEAIRDRRTPVFDDAQGKTIYEVAKSLHEGHGLSKALYAEAVEVLSERGLTEIHRALRLLHAGVADAEHIRVRPTGRGSIGAGVAFSSPLPVLTGEGRGEGLSTATGLMEGPPLSRQAGRGEAVGTLRFVHPTGSACVPES